jgi:hypothetical protein
MAQKTTRKFYDMKSVFYGFFLENEITHVTCNQGRLNELFKHLTVSSWKLYTFNLV